MQPTILYIHDPAGSLSPEPLCSMWAALSPEDSRAFRRTGCRALGWAVTREHTDPQRLAALFSWTDAEAVRSLCSASRPAQALPLLTKLMGLDPLEAWRTIT